MRTLVDTCFFCSSLMALMCFSACGEVQVPGGKITIRNDILDKDYNAFVVDQVMAGGSLSGYRKSLRPNEQATIPFKHIRSLRFTRQYAGYSRTYVVDCPEGMNSALTIKLIDVHTNRLGGGCATVKKGETKNGVTVWEEE